MAQRGSFIARSEQELDELRLKYQRGQLGSIAGQRERYEATRRARDAAAAADEHS